MAGERAQPLRMTSLKAVNFAEVAGDTAKDAVDLDDKKIQRKERKTGETRGFHINS
jgi:hypothetical protein